MTRHLHYSKIDFKSVLGAKNRYEETPWHSGLIFSGIAILLNKLCQVLVLLLYLFSEIQLHTCSIILCLILNLHTAVGNNLCTENTAICYVTSLTYIVRLTSQIMLL